MAHTIIVPGVGGSETAHWQSWLQKQLMSCSRVQQQNWHNPVLNEWVSSFLNTINQIDDELQVVAHSFGCLTTLAALAKMPTLANRIKNLVLVAPANPKRFSESGFAQPHERSYYDTFHAMQVNPISTTMLISENDPWLQFEDAQALARSWKIKPINLGAVGHINVASGFGPFPEIFNFLLAEEISQHINISDDNKHLFRFAI